MFKIVLICVFGNFIGCCFFFMFINIEWEKLVNKYIFCYFLVRF